MPTGIRPPAVPSEELEVLAGTVHGHDLHLVGGGLHVEVLLDAGDHAPLGLAFDQQHRSRMRRDAQSTQDAIERLFAIGEPPMPWVTPLPIGHLDRRFSL